MLGVDATQAPDRIVSIREACSLTGKSRTSLWRMGREGTFPSPVRTGSRSVGYRLSEIVAWMKALETVSAARKAS